MRSGRVPTKPLIICTARRIVKCTQACSATSTITATQIIIGVGAEHRVGNRHHSSKHTAINEVSDGRCVRCDTGKKTERVAQTVLCASSLESHSIAELQPRAVTR
jgi:hypothetical protein